jgi:PAS domain S-box-containing protein
MALGFIFLTLGTTEYVWVLSRIGNPMLVLGRICLLYGTLNFMDKKGNLYAIGSIFALFLILYYYYLLEHYSLAGRTVVVTAAIAVFSLMIAYGLLLDARKPFSDSARFTGAIFLVHGLYLVVVIADTLRSNPLQSYVEYNPVQVFAFIVPIITSTLWTFGFILMVNQRLNAENLEEKENLQQIFNTSPDAALITRLKDGLIVEANAGFSLMSGHSHEESVGFCTRELNLWCDPAEQARFLAELQRTHACENQEFAFQRKDGSRLVGMTSARILMINEQAHVVSVTRDITEQKRAEEALRESEETYRSILKASPDDITITDLDGRILMVSPAAYRMFGYGPGEEMGRHLLDFVVPEDHERARSNILHMYSGGHQKPNEYRGIRKDGSFVDMEVNSGLIRGIHGQPVKMVFVVRDITERRKAEAEREALESRNRQLQKAESLGRMAGAIAHHFNNQLQSVMGNLELMDASSIGVDSARWLASARQAAERAAEVSRLMLAYLGQTVPEQGPSLLAELCRSSLTLIRENLPGMVKVEMDLPFPGPVVRANAGQIQQALANLITNASEAIGHHDGLIRLGLGTGLADDIPTEHRFPVSWQPQEIEYAYLEVADSGCGIADADFEKLFDPFFSTKFIGRGLGLSVVLGIVQAHGGVLTVASRQGQGSTFRVHFPVFHAEIPSHPEKLEPRPAFVAGGTILLVDDDEFLRESTGAILEMLGFALLTAKDGVEALEIFQQHRAEICCVITDLTMPRMDGWETLTALHRLDPDLPVILASGYDRLQIMADAHSVRPRALLSKPYSLVELREALRQALAAGSGGEA